MNNFISFQIRWFLNTTLFFIPWKLLLFCSVNNGQCTEAALFTTFVALSLYFIFIVYVCVRVVVIEILFNLLEANNLKKKNKKLIKYIYIFWLRFLIFIFTFLDRKRKPSSQVKVLAVFFFGLYLHVVFIRLHSI